MKQSLIRCALTSVLLSLLTPRLVRADAPYRVGPEDLLKIRVARHEEMGGDVEVLRDGSVMLPVVGSLPVNGLTVEEIRDQVAKGLRKKLVNPEVSVEVIHSRPQRIFVSGPGVKVSATLDLKEGWRVTEVLANAGGLTVRAEVARATIFRQGDQTIPVDLARIYIDQDPAANLRLQPGDVLDVEEAPTVRIYVTGQVAREGVLDITRGLGVVEALALAGGPTSTAALSQSYLVKHDGRKIPVNLARMINQGMAHPEGTHPTSNPAPAGPVERPLPAGAASAPAIQLTAYTVASPTETRPPSASPEPAAGPDLTLEAGDELRVPENLTKVAVFGTVNHAGTFPLRDGDETTLMDAISLAGGFDKHAQRSNIGIIRMVDGKPVVTEVDMKRLIKGKAINPPLQDRDVVYVPETRNPDWVGKVLPGLQALGATWFYVRP